MIDESKGNGINKSSNYNNCDFIIIVLKKKRDDESGEWSEWLVLGVCA